MRLAIPILVVVLLTGFSSRKAGEHPVAGQDSTQWTPLQVERLASLNAPRGQHRTLMMGGELTVIGGHTDGFRPLETLEYFAGGAWHEVPMNYSHDNGFAIPLADETVLIGGGSAEAFGIGQSWGAEIYDPSSHSARAVGILDRKRTLSSAHPMPDGRVLVAGNWYAEDALAIFDPVTGFSTVKELSSGWERPYILPSLEGDYLVFGPESNSGVPASALVERLLGDAYVQPLLEKWELAYNLGAGSHSNCIGGNTYLLTAKRRDDGEMGLLKVSDGIFSEVALDAPIPLVGSDGQALDWMTPVQVDPPRRQAWMQAIDREGQYHFARIDYDAVLDGGRASVNLFRAECPEGRFFLGLALLAPDGHLVLAGGVAQDERKTEIEDDNFVTTADVWAFRPEPLEEAGFPWGWVMGGILLLGAGSILIYRYLHKRHLDTEDTPDAVEADTKLRTDLMTQMSSLIEEQELFRRKNLHITDVATELATNKTYVSALLNNLSGEKFTSLITRYRVEYAQRLMRERPDMLMDDVADESGFSSRTTFFRSFKALTGMTPQEWKNKA